MRLLRTVNIYNCLTRLPLCLQKRMSISQNPPKARSLFPPFYSPTSQINVLHRCIVIQYGDQETHWTVVCVFPSVSSMDSRTCKHLLGVRSFLSTPGPVSLFPGSVFPPLLQAVWQQRRRKPQPISCSDALLVAPPQSSHPGLASQWRWPLNSDYWCGTFLQEGL